jgi:c-di-GMP-binding flagellar brake protein YcgR
MKMPDKRKYPRIDSLRLLSYTCLNKEGTIINQGMGRTMNVSEGGILLETHQQIDQNNYLFLSIGLKDELIEVKGEVIYHRIAEDGKYRFGIRFLDLDDSALSLLKKYIKAFYAQE